jgi:hypothetical protein
MSVSLILLVFDVIDYVDITDDIEIKVSDTTKATEFCDHFWKELQTELKDSMFCVPDGQCFIDYPQLLKGDKCPLSLTLDQKGGWYRFAIVHKKWKDHITLKFPLMFEQFQKFIKQL